MLRVNAMSEGELDAALGLSYVDLSALDDENAPPMLVPGLLVAGQAHWYMGHPESGKSTLAMYVAREVMALGMNVVWVDWEMGARQAKRRARAVGITDEMMRERFHYTPFPAEFGLDLAAGTARLVHDLERWDEDTLWSSTIVLEGAQCGGPGRELADGRHEVDDSVVLPMRETGASLVVIDHVGKGATRSQPYPRGAGSQLADTDVAFYIEAAEKFSRTKPGELAVTKKKDRDGVLPDFTQRFSIGDGEGKLPIKALESTSVSGVATDDSRGRVRRDVADLLRAQDGTDLTTNQVCQLVKRKAGTRS